MNMRLRVSACCGLAFLLGTGVAARCAAKPRDTGPSLPVITNPHDASPTATLPFTQRFTEPTLDGPTAKFREQLEKGLKLRRPQEKEFVGRIAALVEYRILPRSVVNTSFNWARKRHRGYPFPYFQRAMILRAAKLGVRLNAKGMIVP